MAEKIVKMWFDPEGDFLEVIFEQKAGYFRATDNDQVMQKVDSEPAQGGSKHLPMQRDPADSYTVELDDSYNS